MIYKGAPIRVLTTDISTFQDTTTMQNEIQTFKKYIYSRQNKVNSPLFKNFPNTRIKRIFHKFGDSSTWDSTNIICIKEKN